MMCLIANDRGYYYGDYYFNSRNNFYKGMNMKIEIKKRWSGNVIFSHDVENNTVALTVKAALSASVSLINADLRNANLRDADLSGANLCNAYLSGANLINADLCNANLINADLRDADLSGANLSGADLRNANLINANLRDANLRDANLTPIRDDIWAVLSSAPAEVPSLIAALKNGKVDGSTYEGDCCCLVGTIANARHCEYNEITGLEPNSGRPAERFFLGIKKGDTPETSKFSALAVQWAEEWLNRMKAAFERNEHV